MTKPRVALRQLLSGDQAILAPGAYNALVARLIEEAGFQALYTTGAGIANTFLGQADVGLITMTEMVTVVRRIVDVTTLPVVADIDTGYGNALNVMRTIREFEAAGVAGVQIEDQITPKRCGHFAGKQVIDADEMAGKLRMIVDHRRDPDLMIIARTDARAVFGLDEAMRRAELYLDAGADAIFIEAPTSVEELQLIGARFNGVPLVANMVEGGHTPIVPLSELSAMGYRLVAYANTAMRAGLFAIRQALNQLAQEGTSLAFQDSILSWKDRQRLVRLPRFQELEDRYVPDPDGRSRR